jgi:protein SCO1/2
MTRRLSLLILFLLATVAGAPATALAHPGHPEHDPPPLLRGVDVDQRLNRQVPGDLTFKDETGRPVKLGQFFKDKPVILTLNYLECPQLCPLVLKGVSDSLRSVKYTIGKEFDVVTVSIDPRETPAQAAKAKRTYAQSYGRSEGLPGWHFLTGDGANIGQLAKAVGFKYNYDPTIQQFAHPAVITFVTPEGKIARYLFGINFDPKDVQLALSEASRNQIGSLADKILFRCYEFDPRIGKYSMVALNVMRGGGLLTLGLMAGFILTALRRERRQRAKMPTTEGVG